MSRQHAGPEPSAPPVPEPSLAERARTLVFQARIGSLSTHSRKFPGFPFGSLMPYAADDAGRPVMFISSMAMHTQNLLQDARTSLFIADPGAAGDPLGAARVTLIGTAEEAPAEDVSELYLSRYESARQWQDFSDFAYYRIDVSGIYYVGGFGVMGWISAREYSEARPDPLAESGADIIRHMNEDHADVLRLVALRFAGEESDRAVMTAVDRLGFHLRLHSNDRVHGCRVPFLREVATPEDARLVLIEMARQARA